MSFVTKLRAERSALPLQTAVLCMDCECVSNSRKDRCPVCGSRSLLGLAKIIGGAKLSSGAPRSGAEQERCFDVQIAINWKQILPRELSSALESINDLIGPWLACGQASCHIDVAPVLEARKAEGSQAA